MNYLKYSWLIINIWLLISILLFKTDALTVIVIFFFEILALTVFGFIRRLPHLKKGAHAWDALSPINNIAAFIAMLLTLIIAYFIIVHDNQSGADAAGIVFDIIIANIYLVIFIVALEIIKTAKSLIEKQTDTTYYYTFARILVLMFLVFVALAIAEYSKQSSVAILLACACVFAKSIVEFWITRKDAAS